MMRIRRIFISPGHNFFGRYGQTPGTHAAVEVESVECIAGRGLKGDRFYSYRPDYKGQITFFSSEVADDLQRELQLSALDPSSLRRNVIIEGIDLNTLVGTSFILQGVRFEGVEECRPCVWMNQAVGAGAETWLRGRGGLRAKILSDGTLHRDPA
ncbi:MAG TPA: MOSC domain-containing protein [Candidatus Didemnitutus sp.]|nr:MOSC domain-containing protein [Candidatus Didemnitutus sp.]